MVGEVVVARPGPGIWWVTFNRPEARNAMTWAMYDQLEAIAGEAAADPSLRAIVFAGAGNAFVSGTDISQFREFASVDDAFAYGERIERVVGKLERIPVPTIAAVAGACTGGGAALASVCDLRLATADSRYGFPIARTVGNCLALGNVRRAVALLGVARFKDLLMTARLLDAAEAHAIGLYRELCVDVAALHERALALATQIASYAPLTLRATKEQLRRLAAATPLPDDRDLTALCYGSRDFREGIEAFFAKRPANWQGA